MVNSTVPDAPQPVKPIVVPPEKVDPCTARAHIAVLDVSKGQIAHALGISRTALAKLLHGHRPLYADMEQRIIEAASQLAGISQ